MALEIRNYDPAINAGAQLGVGTATVSGGSVTINDFAGIFTTTSLTTGTASSTNIDLVNSKITTTSKVICTLYADSNTGGLPMIGDCTPGSGSATIKIVNADSRPAGTALNGTLRVAFIVL